MRLLPRPSSIVKTTAAAGLATAAAATAGAIAVGAVAIGVIAVSKFAVGKLQPKLGQKMKLHVSELTVDHLIVRDQSTT
ncbi:MAG TPA: hypothetical protein VFA99_18460 [Acidobacteriaceae bacterium]|nr:hypothetical protein [Acidobacteriaceae bacterium]